jgi:hypothetical protein
VSILGQSDELTDDEQPPPTSPTVDAVEISISRTDVNLRSHRKTYACRYPENMDPSELPMNHTPALLKSSSPLNQLPTEGSAKAISIVDVTHESDEYLQKTTLRGIQ